MPCIPTINFEDQVENAYALFGLTNFICNHFITSPKQVAAFYSKLPTRTNRTLQNETLKLLTMTDKPFQLLHRTFHDTVLQTQSTVQRCSFDYHGQPTTHPLCINFKDRADRACFIPTVSPS